MKHKEVKIEDQRVAILRDGLKSLFWTTLKGILEDEMKEITVTILSKDDLKLSDSAVSDMIKWHSMMDYLARLPELAIESVEKPKVNDGSNEQYPNDPYPLSSVREKITKQ